ncbi:MAG: DUF58 domain-containing protein [Phycisphaerae bacterium]
MARTIAQTGKRLTDLLDPQFVARLDALDIFSRKVLQGKLQGERRSKTRGQSVEFADHRPYVVGDDLRFIDWNVYGRLDQLFLKLFLEELDLSVHVMIDVSASAAFGDPPKEKAIKKLAAALAYIAMANNSRVTVSCFGEGIRRQLAHMRGRHYMHQMAELLLTTDCEGPSDFDRACREVVTGRMGTGVMIVISDFLLKEGFEDGLRRLVSRNYDLYAIQVLSPQEIDPQVSGDLKLTDMEDGDVAEVTISRELIKFYKRNLNAYCNDLKQFCTRRGVQHMLTNSGESMEMLVLNYLRRRGLVR